MEHERRARRSRYPLPGHEHPITKPSARHKRIFQKLDPFFGYKFLTTSTINFFEPVEPIYNSQHLGWLYQSPNFYLDRHPEQERSPTYHYREAVYHLDAAGKRCLEKNGYAFRDAQHRSKIFAHEFLVDMGFYFPLEAFVKSDPALTLIDTRELFEHPNFPKATYKSATPFLAKIGEDRVTLDGRPVVITRDGKSICIPGIQVERNRTKGVRVKDEERSSVGKHIRHAIAAQKSGIYDDLFGFDKVIIPFIFTDAAHERLALQYIGEVKTGGCEFIITKTLPDLAYEDKFPKPSPEFFATPWNRVGYPPFGFAPSDFS